MRIIHLALLALIVPACISSSDAPGGAATSAGCVPGATETCYTGPASTLDVGACHAGVRSCAADGQGFGACEDQVVPQPESCGSTVDVDCDGTTGCSGDTLWKLPLTGDPQIGGVAASDDGEIAIFGWAQTLDAGIGPQGDGTTWSLFAAGIHAEGTLGWLRMFPGVGASARAGAIAMNAQHEATLVVSVEGSFTLGEAPFDAAPSGVLAIRFEEGGAVEAAELVDLSGPAATLAPRVDVARVAGDGSVVVGGAGFLAALGPGVTTTWHHRYAGDVTFADLTFASDGSLFATGSYEGSFEPGGGATPVSGDHAGFLARLAGASVSWSQTLGGDTETRATTVTSLPDGVLAVGGLQAGGGDLISNLAVTGSTAFLAQRNGDGLVSSTFYGWGASIPALAVDAAGDVTVRLEANDPWSGHFIFKTASDGKMDSPTYWMHEFQWAPVSVTLPTGETIAVNQAGVQKLGR